MHACQAPYRELFEALHRHEGASPCADLLVPWVEAHGDERRWLLAFAARRGDPVPAAEVEDLWRLYALSRVIETLLLRFQHGAADGSDWPGPAISLEEVASFAVSIGLSISPEPVFSPFSHEIVSVDQAPDDDQPILLRETLWPCLRLGDMMFSRAGARVSAGRRHARKEIAESSSIYWAVRRKNRPYRDLSQGWVVTRSGGPASVGITGLALRCATTSTGATTSSRPGPARKTTRRRSRRRSGSSS